MKHKNTKAHKTRADRIKKNERELVGQISFHGVVYFGLCGIVFYILIQFLNVILAS